MTLLCPFLRPLWRYILHKAFYVSMNKGWCVHCTCDSLAALYWSPFHRGKICCASSSATINLFKSFTPESCPVQPVAFRRLRCDSLTSPAQTFPAGNRTHTPFGHNQSLSIAAAPTLILYQRTTGKCQTGAVEMRQTHVPTVYYTIRAQKNGSSVQSVS